MKRRLALIGPGRVGQTVVRLLAEAGHEVCAIISRDQARAVAAARFAGCPGTATTDLSRAREAQIVLIALPDDHIGEMAARLRRSGYLAPGAVLVHFSGIHPASILLGEEGPPLHALSIHPLQTFADSVMGVRNLPGSPCAVEGEEALLPLAEALVTDMGGIPLRLTAEEKPLYHAAACLASNYLVTLVDAAAEILAGCGFGREEAFRLLSPLLRGTGMNLAALGPTLALTGPIARGDLHTVRKHLKALEGRPADLQEIYRVMGRKTVQLAWRKGTLDPKAGEKILDLLRDGEPEGSDG
jgi:predicted short-subunit dehydrogenase-like oxidoreductase (DUF2520 family)